MQIQISFDEFSWAVCIVMMCFKLNCWFAVFPTSDKYLVHVCIFLHRKFQFHVNSFAWADLKNLEKTNKQKSLRYSTLTPLYQISKLRLSLCVSQVQLTVMDVNDFRPRFSERVYTSSMFENEPVGTSVITMKALDLDEGENALLTYSLQGPGAGKLHTHRNTEI